MSLFIFFLEYKMIKLTEKLCNSMPLLYLSYSLLIIIINLYSSIKYGNVCLCDDTIPRTVEWGSEWNKDEYDNGENRGNNEYVAYRPGLQHTSEGYRYEADGRPVNYQWTNEGYRHEAYGRAVDNHPYSYESTRNVRVNQMYESNNNNLNSNYENTNIFYRDGQMYDQGANVTGSTRIGFIGGEPNNSAINRYIKEHNNVLAPYKVIDNRKKSVFKSAINFIKEDLRATRIEATKSRKISGRQDEILMNGVRDSYTKTNVLRQHRRNITNHSMPKKVRRFD